MEVFRSNTIKNVISRTHKYLGIVLQFPSLNNVSTYTNDQLKVRKHFYRHFTVVERWKISLYECMYVCTYVQESTPYLISTKY